MREYKVNEIQIGETNNINTPCTKRYHMVNLVGKKLCNSYWETIWLERERDAPFWLNRKISFIWGNSSTLFWVQHPYTNIGLKQMQGRYIFTPVCKPLLWKQASLYRTSQFSDRRKTFLKHQIQVHCSPWFPGAVQSVAYKWGICLSGCLVP